MRSYSYGGNPFAEFRYGHIHLTEQPWYLCLVEWFADNAHKYVPRWGLPKWIYFRPRDRETEQRVSLREWYGTIQDVWCVHVCMPLFRYVWEHPKRHEYTVEVGWDTLKKTLYDADKSWFDDIERDLCGGDGTEEQDSSH